MRKLILLPILALLLTACANPIEKSRPVDHRPSIVIKDAPAGAELIVDGIAMGAATDYADKALLLESGTHVVRVTHNGAVILSEKIYVSGAGTKTLTVRSTR